jgi:hypothetical protein
VTATPCPAGTYNSATTGGSLSACTICPSGSYCLQACTAPIACPTGYICRQGTSTATQFPCLAGTYRSSGQAFTYSDCAICPSGSYCDQGTTNPNTCPQGYYCPAGTISYSEYPCPAGTYNSATGQDQSSDCVTCPVGNYCPVGSQAPTQCPMGTYLSTTGAAASTACVLCPSSYVCSTPGASAYSAICQAGYYCPAGSINAASYPCRPGTYLDRTDGHSSSDCIACPQSYACSWGTTGSSGSNPMVACSAGHYCPAFTGGASDYQCPPGTYSSSTSLYSSSQCTQCPAGSYCLGGDSAVSGTCTAGFYCPAGSSWPTTNPCPAGTYSTSTGLVDSAGCTSCPTGNFCLSGSSSATQCRAGTYTSATRTESDGYDMYYLGGATSSFPACTTCPAGSYCSAGATVSTTCSIGYYSPAGAGSCLTCPVGYYCDVQGLTQSTMLSSKGCPAGYYCPAGTSTTLPSSGFICPAGFYCPLAVSEAIPCPAGTYGPSTGLQSSSQCTDCPAGQYCVPGQSLITGYCDAGFYCPSRSSGPTQEPCPAGFRRTSTGARSSSDCTTCLAGSYCPEGSSVGLACPQGAYCPAGSLVPTLCPKGTYGSSTSLLASADCTLCDPGYFCDGLGLIHVRDVCDPGYYCILGADTSQPRSGALNVNGDPMGGPCPRGGYCEAGSWEPTSCPAGTYQNITGSRDIEGCTPCYEGFYCASNAQPEATGPCAGGYYCELGANSPYQHVTPVGHYSLPGSSAPTPCDPGTFGPSSALEECYDCPAGFYCPEQATVIVTLCPAGSYCRNASFIPEPCPIGTYSTATGLSGPEHCNLCDPGTYCGTNALPSPSGPCDPGYYCSFGSSTPRPYQESFGDWCPAGYYCPEGTIDPYPCPLGTYSSSLQAVDNTTCLPCTPGKYCDGQGLSEVSGDCLPGWYCTSGAIMNATYPDGPQGGRCPPGYYCPAGTAAPIDCPDGHYSNSPGLSECMICPAHYYCNTTCSSPLSCPAGAYCPAGTGAVQPLCPAGTYSNQDFLAQSSECTDCDPGWYCNSTGLTSPSGECLEGYYCRLSAVDPYGRANTNDDPFICPHGAYCPTGTGDPILCSAGYFSAHEGNTNVNQCHPCTPGYFCENTGLSQVTAHCAEGYYCSGNASISAPIDGVTGDICPRGYYCPLGSEEPIPCPPGTFMNQLAAAECLACPAGFYCLNATINYNSNLCPEGYYCPIGTAFAEEFPCPNGTVGVLPGSDSLSDCLPCFSGSYCDRPGSDSPTTYCPAGFYCPSGTIDPIQCEIGSYCPASSRNLVSCPGGQFCDQTQLSEPSGVCMPGFYCSGGANQSNPTDGVTGNICPMGAYCAANSTAPLLCDLGTFLPSEGNDDVGDCIPCRAGSYCDSPGLIDSGALCPEGFFCPTGTIDPTSYCTPGHYCPEGSFMELECPPGYYAPSVLMTNCTICDAGYFCGGNATITPDICPRGSYCPAGTTHANQFLCPRSTFSNLTGLVSIDNCTDCTSGYYCDSAGLLEPSGECSAGFYCSGKSSSPVPSDPDNGNQVCPIGHYCPAGSPAPLWCPMGTYSLSVGFRAESNCVPCRLSQYCTNQTLSDSSPCDAGFLCISGAFQPNPPANSTTGHPCSPGTYCPQGATSELLCRRGYFNSNYGQASCSRCTAGYYCDDVGLTDVTAPCPAGHYCPTGSIEPTPCPSGTFSSLENGIDINHCAPCSRGSYCDGQTLTNVTAECMEGYYCDWSSTDSSPELCPVGRYCPAGRAVDLFLIDMLYYILA